MEQISLLFHPGRLRGYYQWVSQHQRLLVGLCNLPSCTLCNLPAREKLAAITKPANLSVLLELRSSYGGVGIAPRKRYIGHLLSLSEVMVEVPSVVEPAVEVDIEVEPEGAEIDVACNVLVCESRGEAFAIDPGAMGFEEEGEKIVRKLVTGRNVRGVAISHSHMDHYNGLAGLDGNNSPIFTTYHGRRVIRHYAYGRLEPERTTFFRLLRNTVLITPSHPGVLEIGSAFKVSTFLLPHSIPGTMGLLVRGGQKKLAYLGDFKLNGFDSRAMARTVTTLREIAKEGVDILALNIINAHIGGFTPIEALVIETITNILVRAPERVIITCFSTNIERIRRIVTVARLLKRPVAFYGAGMDFSQKLLGIKAEEGAAESEGAVVFVTGCQAEEGSVLWRIAKRQNPLLELRVAKDILIFSSRGIPDNEEELRQQMVELRPQVNRMIVSTGEVTQVGLKDLGVEEAPTHISGHEYGGGLRWVLETFRPKQVFAWPQTSPKIEAFREMAEGLGIKILPEKERVIEL